jgi:hypothetical protein
MVFGDRVDRIRWIIKDILQQLRVLPKKSQDTLISRGLMTVSLLDLMICLFLLSRRIQHMECSKQLPMQNGYGL